MTLFRGSGGDLPLMPWLEERIWPVEAKLDDGDVYAGMRATIGAPLFDRDGDSARMRETASEPLPQMSESRACGV